MLSQNLWDFYESKIGQELEEEKQMGNENKVNLGILLEQARL